MYLKFLWLACLLLVMVMSLREEKPQEKEKKERIEDESTDDGEGYVEYSELEESIEERRRLKRRVVG